MSWEFKGVPESMINETKINFGKHKGKFVKDLPVEYCKWLIENGINKQYGKYLKRAINKRARE